MITELEELNGRERLRGYELFAAHRVRVPHPASAEPPGPHTPDDPTNRQAPLRGDTTRREQVTVLQIMPDSGRDTLLRTTDPARTEAELGAHHVEFRRRPTDHALSGEAGQEEVLALYQALVRHGGGTALLRHPLGVRGGVSGERAAAGVHVRFAHSSRSMPKSTRS
ncbi:hypothetical protein [Streptomyces sp. NPDC047841]|uniref:hypothetical protein n=1 Tax=Streptomyces sp. NPDC047841 TaxID=3154708 RepID=UPI003452144E